MRSKTIVTKVYTDTQGRRHNVSLRVSYDQDVTDEEHPYTFGAIEVVDSARSRVEPISMTFTDIDEAFAEFDRW